MYILIVSRGCPTKEWPLYGIFEFDQARALAQAGQKVVFAAVDVRSFRRWRKWGIEHFIKDGVEVYAVNIPIGRAPHCIQHYAGCLGLRALYRLIRKDHGDPDIVHAHFLNMASVALSLRARLDAVFVTTEHWSLLMKEYKALPSWIKEQAPQVYRKYDKVICVSRGLAESLKKLFNVSDTDVVYNVLDPIFSDVRNIRSAHTSFNFVFVGNLIDIKSPLECIQAFYDAFHNVDFTAPDGRNICLRIIGGGPLFSNCRRLIKDLGVEPNVFMEGRMTRDKIAGILSASDCFVLPSKSETFGVVYIEAMACGLPVIATKCGGPESFVNKNNGILIPVNDWDSLVSAFREMAANIDRYDKKEIVSWVSDRFSQEAIAHALINVYLNTGKSRI